MASNPALACCNACPPVKAPNALTYPFFDLPSNDDQSRCAPRLAKVCSGLTEPRNLMTSSAL